jgi:Asp-tRNA(Asn)/Glu-tRNA(Gln) amidotransferase A subunit family amidase
MSLYGLDAAAIRSGLIAGRMSCAELATELLDALEQDPYNAWETVDGELLLAFASVLDRLSGAARADRPLFGVPVGLKDNFDTADLPTMYGSPIYSGWQPDADAEVVGRLRMAGALIAGKTKLAEFAWMHPPDTLNPLDPTRTPGGSSSGSAVAVAAGTVPLATGTQTAGSVNRPASYCGVVGFKPTFGLIPRDGIKPLGDSLDTVGVLARSVESARILAGVLAGDPTPFEPDARLRIPPHRPKLAFARTPIWNWIEPEAQRAIERVAGRVPDLEEVELPPGFTELLAAQTEIQSYEAAQSLAPERNDHAELLSDELRSALTDGARIPAERYGEHLRTRASFGPPLTRLLARYDAVLTPSTTGVPPVGRHHTGDPMCSRVWTLIGAPSISLPLAWTDDGLPVGLQLVGAPYRDGALLEAAASLG